MLQKEVNTRLAKAATVFRRPDNVWKSGFLGLSTKLQLYTAVVVSTAIYASETWKSTRRIQKKMDVFHQRNLRKIIRVTWKDKVTNTEVLKRTGQRRLPDTVGERFQFAGHILQMALECPAHSATDSIPADSRKDKLAKYGTDSRLFRTNVSANFKVS